MSAPEGLTRTSPFSYHCNRCMSCCYGAHIALNPYEITRLARSLQLSTTDFIARHLTGGGIVLRNRDRGACIMLGDASCKVYADRPLICRTYPLLRTLGANGEKYVRHKPLPESKGIYGDDGTVAGFLQRYEIAAFVAANDRYFELLQRIIEALACLAGSVPELFPAIRRTIESHCEFLAQDTPELIDVDCVVAEFCRNSANTIPEAIDDLIRMHISAIEEKLTALRERVAPGGVAPRSTSTMKADTISHETLELAALAGALGAATSARVGLLLAAAVLGKPTELATDKTRGPGSRTRR